MDERDLAAGSRANRLACIGTGGGGARIFRYPDRHPNDRFGLHDYGQRHYRGGSHREQPRWR